MKTFLALIAENPFRRLLGGLKRKAGSWLLKILILVRLLFVPRNLRNDYLNNFLSNTIFIASA
jgi:hypothetical protein